MSHDNPFESPQSSFDEPSTRRITPYDGEKLNPWFSVWLRPRATIRYVIETDPASQVWGLACLAGIAGGFQNVATNNPEAEPNIAVLIGACIGGAGGGAIAFLIMSALVRWTSSWIGGVANVAQVRAAMAWSYVPAISGLLVWIPLGVMFGGDVFTKAFWERPGDATQSLAIAAVGGVHMILGIWQFVIHCKMLGEVNEFSAWRGLGASILAGLVIVVPLVVIFVAAVIALRG